MVTGMTIDGAPTPARTETVLSRTEWPVSLQRFASDSASPGRLHPKQLLSLVLALGGYLIVLRLFLKSSKMNTL